MNIGAVLFCTRRGPKAANSNTFCLALTPTFWRKPTIASAGLLWSAMLPVKLSSSVSKPFGNPASASSALARFGSYA